MTLLFYKENEAKPGEVTCFKALELQGMTETASLAGGFSTIKFQKGN